MYSPTSFVVDVLPERERKREREERDKNVRKLEKTERERI